MPTIAHATSMPVNIMALAYDATIGGMNRLSGVKGDANSNALIVLANGQLQSSSMLPLGDYFLLLASPVSGNVAIVRFASTRSCHAFAFSPGLRNK
jgi:hypothetical protein